MNSISPTLSQTLKAHHENCWTYSDLFFQSQIHRWVFVGGKFYTHWSLVIITYLILAHLPTGRPTPKKVSLFVNTIQQAIAWWLQPWFRCSFQPTNPSKLGPTCSTVLGGKSFHGPGFISRTVLSKIPLSVFPNIGSTTLSDQKAQSWHFSKLGAQSSSAVLEKSAMAPKVQLPPEIQSPGGC